MENANEITYYGKPIETLSREELLEAFYSFAESVKAERARHQKYMEFNKQLTARRQQLADFLTNR